MNLTNCRCDKCDSEVTISAIPGGMSVDCPKCGTFSGPMLGGCVAVTTNRPERNVITDAEKAIETIKNHFYHGRGSSLKVEAAIITLTAFPSQALQLEKERDEAKKEAKAFEQILSDVGVNGGYPDADSWEDYPNNARLIKEGREHEEKRADALQARLDGAAKGYATKRTFDLYKNGSSQNCLGILKEVSHPEEEQAILIVAEVKP